MIPETQGPSTLGKKTKNHLNFKEKSLKLQYYVILKLQVETFLNYFNIRNLRNHKVSQIQKVAKFYYFANTSFMLYYKILYYLVLSQMPKLTWSSFLLRTDNIKKDGKEILGYIFPNAIMLRSAEVHELLRWLNMKGDFITSKKDKKLPVI